MLKLPRLHQKIKFLNRFDPEEKSLRYQTMLGLVTAFMLIIAGGCLGLLSLYFSAGKYNGLFIYILKQPTLTALNLLPFIALALVLWGMTNRAWIAFLVDSIICLVYSWANYWKLMGRSDAVYAEDLTILKEGLQIGTSEGYITFSFRHFLSIGCVIFGTVILFLFFRGKLRPLGLRIPLTVVLAGLSIFAYTGVYTNDARYNSFQIWPELNPWIGVNSYISRGGIYPFLYSVKSAVATPPEGYNEEEAEEKLLSYENDSIPEDKQVNVVMVMMEAFSDLSDHTNAITGADPYVDYHNLQKESYTGELLTNVFAGGTIDTERSVITGFSNLSSFRRKSWSYAKYFSENGYAAVGAHAGYEAFYNRVNVNRNLGFDDYRFIENYFNKSYDGIPGDAQLLPAITKQVKEITDSGKSVFSFNVTYQNHGPYTDNVLESEKIYVPKGDLSDYDYNIVNNYLRGIEDTGKQVMAMVDSFRESEEPVVLVFFGDHKPWLGNNSSTYQALGISFESGATNGVYNMYQTDYIIWANDAAKEKLGNDFVGTGPTISPCFLMNVLFEQCGWKGPSYMKFSNEIMKESPIVSGLGWYGKSPEFVQYDSLNEDVK